MSPPFLWLYARFTKEKTAGLCRLLQRRTVRIRSQLKLIGKARRHKRHTFAVHRLEDWYRQGANLAAKLPVLSVYMGHQSLAGTQRYLRLTPALFLDVVASVEAVVGHAMPRRER
jgi:integrase